VKDVYVQMSSYLITTNESLRLLSDAGIAWEERILSLPSWVPNLNALRPSTRLGPPVQNGYKAGGNCSPNFYWNSSSDDLIVRGILVDTISKLSSCYLHHSKRPKHFLQGYLCKISELLNESRLEPHDPIVRECLWRTLLVDRTGERGILPPEYGEWFDSFDLYYTDLENFAEGFS
jgi:hypothetical protein